VLLACVCPAPCNDGPDWQELMTPAEFNKRINGWAWRRCAIQLSQTTIEDWVHEGLLAPARATGLARTVQAPWERSCRDIKQAIRICRYKSRVPADRRFKYDEIRIQLWLDKANLEAIDIRRLVLDQFHRGRQELLRPQRSIFDPRDTEGISEKRITTSIRQMGEASPEILPEGFNYLGAELVGMLALTRFEEFTKIQFGDSTAGSIDLVNSILDRWGICSSLDGAEKDAVAVICSIFAGLLGDPDEVGDTAEGIIKSADTEKFEIARDMTRALPWVIGRAPEILTALDPAQAEKYSALVEPWRRIARAIRTEPQWRLTILVLMLVILHRPTDQARSIVMMLRAISRRQLAELISRLRKEAGNSCN
jgi:hypothetical protein